MRKSALGSRLRLNPVNVFDCFCEVAAPVPGDDGSVGKPWILQKYPENFNNEEMLKSMPDFVFPCEFDKAVVQHWSFVLTNIDSKWTFGFCRHSGGGSGSDTALVILSCLPWHEVFFKVLNEIATLLFSGQTKLLFDFLKELHSAPMPDPGKQLHIPLPNLPNGVFSASCPDHFSLPKIPDNRNLAEYFNAVDHSCMIEMFAAMLRERRIIVVSKRLSRLSACVQAANALIAPMNWQHIFIPILPLKLIEYLSAPMPFLIGVPAPIFAKVRRNEVGDAVILKADENRIETPFRDAEGLPSEVLSALKRSLGNPTSLIGEGVSRSFLRALVALIGGYRDALRLREGSRVTFDSDMFIKTRPSATQPYLRDMLGSQIFQQFIDERLDMMNSGQGFSDEFELEAALHGLAPDSKIVHGAALKEWMGSVKKEGGNLFKSVRTKANPAMKQAVETVREKSKSVKHKSQSAVRDFKSKLGGEREAASGDSSGQLRSAPSSPTSIRSSKKGSFEFRKVDRLISHGKPASDANLSSKADAVDSKLGNGSVQEGVLVYFDGGDSDPAETPSLSSSSSSVDLEPPALDSFDLLTDLEQAFDQRLSAKSSNSGDDGTPEQLKSSRSAGNLLTVDPPPPSSSSAASSAGAAGVDARLGHPNPLYSLHYPEVARQDSGLLPHLPARKRLSFEKSVIGNSAPSAFLLMSASSSGFEPRSRPLPSQPLMGAAASPSSAATATSAASPFSPPLTSANFFLEPSAAAGGFGPEKPTLPPPLVPVPSSTSPSCDPLSTVSSRKAFFDSLLDDGAEGRAKGHSTPKTSWTTFD